MSKFLFVTDLHGMLSCEGRVDSPLEALQRKLSWCVDWCNTEGASLILGGDIFDRPTAPHEVSNALRETLRCCRNGVYAVWGNHDILYRQSLYKPKCALYGFRDFIRFVDEAPVEGPDFYLTGVFPREPHSKIVLYVGHAFLDIPDGDYSVSRIDIGGYQGRMVCLLGHDHSVYPAENCGMSVILRPGSLMRCRRSLSELRDSVYGYVIDTTAETYSSLSIPCSPCSSVFRLDASALPAVKENAVDLDSLFAVLREESVGAGLTFEEALRKVATEEVAAYVMSKI